MSKNISPSPEMNMDIYLCLHQPIKISLLEQFDSIGVFDKYDIRNYDDSTHL